jgi:catechol 2,3-dioxygenase-like lactoylglutathione lyase family enzyme
MAARSLFSRIDTVILRVHDHAAAVAWYEQQLGLTAVFTDPAERLSVLEIGDGATLTLWERKADEAEPDAGHAGTFPIFSTEDALATHRRLAESGVRVSEVNESPGVRYFTFWDLDGNRLEACELSDHAA